MRFGGALPEPPLPHEDGDHIAGFAWEEASKGEWKKQESGAGMGKPERPRRTPQMASIPPAREAGCQGLLGLLEEPGKVQEPHSLLAPHSHAGATGSDGVLSRCGCPQKGPELTVGVTSGCCLCLQPGKLASQDHHGAATRRLTPRLGTPEPPPFPLPEAVSLHHHRPSEGDQGHREVRELGDTALSEREDGKWPAVPGGNVFLRDEPPPKRDRGNAFIWLLHTVQQA